MSKYQFKSYTKKSGVLTPFSLKNDIPFKTKRIFLIYGNKNFTRGNHAHKKCSQFLVPILGKVRVSTEYKKIKKNLIINYKNKKGFLLKPNTWCKVKFLTNNSILMVFCDMEYSYKDYIENYNIFKKIK